MAAELEHIDNEGGEEITIKNNIPAPHRKTGEPAFLDRLFRVLNFPEDFHHLI